jgi:site-specific DNA-methyltransferase (adenine-specific)
MFSFFGDVVLDPFGGTGTTALAALKLGRSSISYEIEDKYLSLIKRRLGQPDMFREAVISYEDRDGI